MSGIILFILVLYIYIMYVIRKQNNYHDNHNNINLKFKNLNEIYFSDHDYLVKKRKWPCVDEYALSLYIKLNNIKVNLSDSVNKSRSTISKELKSYQTVHYSGIKSKKLFLKECSLRKVGPSG